MKPPPGPTGTPLPEAILLAGREGSGKTWATLCTARAIVGSGGRVFIIDGDFSRGTERALGGSFRDLAGDVEHSYAFQWETITELGTKYADIAGPGDLVVVEFAYQLWDAVQDWWERSLRGKSAAEVSEDKVRKMVQSGKKAPEPREPHEWTAINAHLRNFMISLVYQSGAHTIFTTSVKEMRSDSRDQQAVKDLWGPWGVKAAGQSELGHQMQTVLLMKRKRNTWTMTTVKDRDRPLLEDEEWDDFAEDYLVEVAGWQKEVKRKKKGQGEGDSATPRPKTKKK